MLEMPFCFMLIPTSQARNAGPVMFADPGTAFVMVRASFVEVPVGRNVARVMVRVFVMGVALVVCPHVVNMFVFHYQTSSNVIVTPGGIQTKLKMASNCRMS